jgi:predicted ArsR family transcriptional regulator
VVQTRWDRRFRASTRGQLVELLCRAPRTAEELARALGITPNAVRAQIAALERDGLVQQAGLRREARKPSQLYALTPQAERLFPKPYGLLLSRLLDVLAERVPFEELEAVLREVGQRIGLGHRAAGDLRARVERAAELLGEFGGVAEVDDSGEHFLIRGYCCPLAAVVSGHPEACLLAEMLLTEVIAAPVREQCERGDFPKCVFEVLAAA